jgi:hypothetical protein
MKGRGGRPPKEPPSKDAVRQRIKRLSDKVRKKFDAEDYDPNQWMFGPEWHELALLWMWQENRALMLERHTKMTEDLEAIHAEVLERLRDVENQKRKLDEEVAQWVRDKLG